MLKLFPKKWYKCTKCNGIWIKGWSDEECAKEYKENFPNDPDMKYPVDIICDDCYKKEFKPQFDNLTPEEKEEIEKGYKLEIGYEKDLEKITLKFAERFMDYKYGYRLTIPKEDEGSLTEYSDFVL